MAKSDMDPAFTFDEDGLRHALGLLAASEADANPRGERTALDIFPAKGLGERETLSLLAPHSIEAARRFNRHGWFAHMDPPTPWITWAAQLWVAALNQNLLHPDTGEVGREIEDKVIGALAPRFAMSGGHMVPGSTVANLTALWAARELAEVTEVVASDLSHLSIAKAAQILGLSLRLVPSDGDGKLRQDRLGDTRKSCLVLTAGTTNAGSIDPLNGNPEAAWTHVDAAWAGPLRLSNRHKRRLDGIESADSISVSAHKWLWQPKDSALVLFRDAERAHGELSFGGAYLAAANVGLLGSSAARAVPLAATLMAFGADGIAARIDKCMEIAERFANRLADDERFELWNLPEAGVVAWRPRRGDAETLRTGLGAKDLHVSQTSIAGETWLRSVAIHPFIDADAVFEAAASGLAPC